MKNRFAFILVFLSLSFVWGCGRHHVENVRPATKKLVILSDESGRPGQRPYVINGERYYPLPDAEGFVQNGIASWYGKKFHGRPTASGEIFDMHGLSAAHKTLPLGTYVKATNLSNHKQVVVRINDRGPFVKGRIIDLSYAAARKIDLIGLGTARVKIVALGKEIQKIDSPTGKKPVVEFNSLNAGVFAVQVVALKNRDKALALCDKLKPIYENVDVEVYTHKYKGTLYRVRVSKSKTLASAKKIEKELQSMGFENAFIVRL